jgi:macrolide transport system ATP-binding/permease protein
MTKPLIELKDVKKRYMMGNTEVNALNGVSLTIESGEFVAIMGASGSGKSTMLNILCFLDTPTQGSYRIMGHDVTVIDEDKLSILRNHIAGFVFQQFHLLPKVSALNNVLLPTLYAGKKNMKESAENRLYWVGMGHRIEHYPNELSGGEQQRVAIARSIVNEPAIIFADEPTGNLDSRSEKEVIALLEKLNSEGKTIIMVTHEEDIASHASRIIRVRDGEILSDEKKGRKIKKTSDSSNSDIITRALEKTNATFGRAEFADYIRQAVMSILSHKMRALLSMLGILIGVAAVISMLAVGMGAQKSIESNLNNLGTNVLTVMPGFRRSGGVRLQMGAGSRLTVQDGESFLKIQAVKRISGSVNDRAQAVYGANNTNTQIMGTDVDYAEMRASVPTAGRFFTEPENRSRKRVAVIGVTVVKNLFPGGENPLGKTIKINKINFTVIGVLPARGAAMMRDQDDLIIVPLKTAMYRLLGKLYLDQVHVEVTGPEVTESVKEKLIAALDLRHKPLPGQESMFEVRDMAEIRKALMSTAGTMSALLGAVAAISLVVGGVGVMNIKLVSVKERTKEIGLRKAIGARRRDILLQFLVEAVLLTFIGGVTGIILGVSVSLLLSAVASWPVVVSVFGIIGAALFTIIMGIIFGIWPAMQASRLNPIEALRYE